MIYVGIPSCILFVEFTLTYKFCRRFDDDLGVYLDGMTICECMTWVISCGKSNKIRPVIQDDYDYKFEEPTDEQLSQIESKKKAANQCAPSPATFNPPLAIKPVEK
jgi:hypothetical protein